MKNKRLVIILSVFVFLTLVVVLSSTVFVVNSIEVNWSTTTTRFTPADNSKIVESAKFKQNESVFLFNKTEYISNLEKENPYLKVVGIEIAFPNKVILRLAEREVFYALNITRNQSSENTYVLLDDELKVLEIAQITSLQMKNLSYNVLEMLNISFSVADFEVGIIADTLHNGQMLSELSVSLNSYYTSKNNNNPNININLEVEKLVDKIYISTFNQLLISTDWGLHILVEDAANNLFDKIILGVDAYNNMRDEYYNKGIIKVLWVENAPKAHFIENEVDIQSTLSQMLG